MSTLRRLSLLKTLDDGEFAQLERASTRHVFRAGTIVVSQGDDADALFAVLEGRLKVSLLRTRGAESVLTMLGPGDVFGELALFDESTRSAQVTALERTEVVRISHVAFRALLGRSARLGVAFSRHLASRVRAMARHFEAVTSQPVESRLAQKLSLLAPGPGCALGLTQQELADACETTRQSINRCLRKWHRLGLIEGSGRRLRVRDAARLRELSLSSDS